MTNINLITTNNESLSSLADKAEQGFSVLRSAHVGNARAYNLAIANEKIDMMLVDHTITGKDRNYRPEAVIRDGEMTQVAEMGQLAFRTVAVIDEQSGYLDRLHTDVLREAFPRTQITTNTEYLRHNERLTGEIVKSAANLMPELFVRIVPADEVTAIEDARAAVALALDGRSMQIADDPRTERVALLPNEVDIVANFVIEALRSERSAQYHISGPDMVNYMTRPKSKDDQRTPLEIVNALYAELASTASFREKLPEELTVNLVPGAHARFATTTERAGELDKLLYALGDATVDLTDLNRQRGEFFRSAAARDGNAKKAFVARSNDERQGILAAFKSISDRCSDLFVGPTDAPYISQYDVRAEGGLYVPDAIRAMTMAELAQLSKEIAALRRGVS